MYETLEHWKQYKLDNEAKELQNKISQEKELFNECGFQYKKEAYKQMDKLLTQLSKKNGTTKY
jgi:hypothetical protein